MDYNQTMLIVDDAEANREVIISLFSNEFHILTAEDGIEAMELIRKYSDTISVILLDIIMPKMDGICVLKWLSDSAFSHIPVIAVTSDENYQLEALENGAADFIAKPADNNVIKARVNNALGRYAFEKEKKINATLKKTRLEMDNLINSIPGGIAIYRLTDHFETEYFSDGVAELSGYTREEYGAYIQGDATKIIYEEDRSRVLESSVAALKSGKAIDETYRIYHKSGELVWVRLNAVSIEKVDEAYVIHAVFQKPSKMMQLYDNLVNESQSAIYVNDARNYDLLYMNHTMLTMLGKEQQTYTGRKCYEFLFNNTEPCSICKMKSMNTEQYMLRDFTYPINGREYSMRGKLLDWNGIPAHTEYILDVTQEHNNQRQVLQVKSALEKSHKQVQETLNSFQSLVNTVPGGIALYEVDGQRIATLFYSDGLCELSGYSREEREIICHEDAMALTYKDDIPLLRETIRNAVAQHTNIDLTYRIKTKQGQPRWINLRGTYSKSKSGRPAFHAVFTDVDGIKRMEESAKELQLRYEVAIKSSEINIWEYDIQRDVLTVISYSARIKQDCFIIENYIDSAVKNGYVRQDCVEDFYDIFKRLKKGEREVVADIWYKTTDEAGWWCERVIYTTVFDDDGIPVKAFGAGRDVTREKDAIKKFNEEMSYRAAIQKDNLDSLKINLTNNTIIEGDSPFKVLGELIDGNDIDRYFAKTAEYIIGEENKVAYKALFNRKALINRFNSGEYFATMEFARVFDTHKIYWLKYNVHLMKNPETQDIIAFIVATDITDEKVMKTIMETVAKTDYEFFVVVDGCSNSAIDYTMSSGKRLFVEGEPFEEKNEAYIRHCVCEEDVPRVIEECKLANVLKNMQDGTSHKLDFNMREDSGEIHRKQLQLTLINRERKTFLMTRIDVNGVYNEQKKSQRKLEEALAAAEQASKVKTDFLAKMSHDIRTPMNAIIGMTALARDENNPPATVEYLNNIDSSSHFLLGLINDILDFSKIENDRIELYPEPFAIEEFERNINTVIRPLMEAKHIDFVFRLNCGAKCIMVDKLRYNQIYFNLLSNAVKFTPEGGRVEFVSEHIPDRDGKHGMRCYVRDSGTGMSDEFLQHLFEPFTQEKMNYNSNQQGTGLGLSIVKNLIAAMGGSIRVSSTLGKGTEFVVDLYAEEAVNAVEKNRQALPDSSLDGRHILLVEDNRLNIVVAKRLLERKGSIVDVAVNGKIAVEQFLHSAPEYYDAILMDVRMPVMGGIEATEHIRALDRTDARTVPIIAMTADAFAEDQDKTQGAGMNTHLSKPIEPQKLYDTIACLIKPDAQGTGRS